MKKIILFLFFFISTNSYASSPVGFHLNNDFKRERDCCIPTVDVGSIANKINASSKLSFDSKDVEMDVPDHDKNGVSVSNVNEHNIRGVNIDLLEENRRLKDNLSESKDRIHSLEVNLIKLNNSYSEHLLKLKIRCLTGDNIDFCDNI